MNILPHCHERFSFEISKNRAAVWLINDDFHCKSYGAYSVSIYKQLLVSLILSFLQKSRTSRSWIWHFVLIYGASVKADIALGSFLEKWLFRKRNRDLTAWDMSLAIEALGESREVSSFCPCSSLCWGFNCSPISPMQTWHPLSSQPQYLSVKTAHLWLIAVM